MCEELWEHELQIEIGRNQPDLLFREGKQGSIERRKERLDQSGAASSKRQNFSRCERRKQNLGVYLIWERQGISTEIISGLQNAPHLTNLCFIFFYLCAYVISRDECRSPQNAIKRLQ